MDDRIGWVFAAYGITALVLVGYALQLRLARGATRRDESRHS